MSTKADKQHILVINDTPEILDLFRVLLEDEGYSVSTDTFEYAILSEKFAEVKRQRPDMIILDYLIGGESAGWQFLQLLKMEPQTQNIPIVICTAAVRQVEELRGRLTEMSVGIVLKPFDIDQLVTEIKNTFRRHETSISDYKAE